MLKNIFGALFGFLVFRYADTPMEIIISEPLKSIPEPTPSPPPPTPSARKHDLNDTINAIVIFEKIVAKYGCETLYVHVNFNNKLVYECDANPEKVIGDHEPLDS